MVPALINCVLSVLCFGDIFMFYNSANIGCCFTTLSFISYS